jgi:hypothetical protein
MFIVEFFKVRGDVQRYILYRFYTFITLLSSHFLVLNCSINQQSWSRWTPGELISEQDGMQTRHKAVGYCGASIWSPQSHRAVEFDSRTFLESLPFRATILLTHHHVTMCFENLWWPPTVFVLHLCCHSHARDQRRLWTPVAFGEITIYRPQPAHIQLSKRWFYSSNSLSFDTSQPLEYPWVKNKKHID